MGTSSAAPVAGGDWLVENYPSADQFHEKLLEFAWREIGLGRLSVSPVESPGPTAAVAVIPKKGGTGIRVITDHTLRSPEGALGANAIVDRDAIPPCVLPATKELLPIASLECAAVTDISEAYRHLRVQVQEPAQLILNLGGLLVRDEALPMGHAASAGIQQTLLLSVLAALQYAFKSLKIKGYIDDVLLAGDEREVNEAHEVLLTWLSLLHLWPAETKIQHPGTLVTYLGFEIDLVRHIIKLTDERNEEILRDLAILRRLLRSVGDDHVLAEALERASRLLGQLVFISMLHPPMRAFYRGIELLAAAAPCGARRKTAPVRRVAGFKDAIVRPPRAEHAPASMGFKAAAQQARPTHEETPAASPATRAEDRATRFRWIQGRAFTLRWSYALVASLSNLAAPPPDPDEEPQWIVHTDASTQAGGIVVRHTESDQVWLIHVNFPEIEPRRITHAEMAMVAVCLADENLPFKFAPRDAIWFHLDNHASVTSLAQWHCKEMKLANILAIIAQQVSRRQVRTKFIFLPGVSNTMADRLSRVGPDATREKLASAFSEISSERIRSIHAPAAITRWL